MRQHEEVGQLEEGRVEFRFTGEHVEARCADASVAQGLDQGLVVHQVATGDVHQDEPRPRLRQQPRIDQSTGFGCGGTGEQEHIRLGNQGGRRIEEMSPDGVAGGEAAFGWCRGSPC